jgi:hypothetical protein
MSAAWPIILCAVMTRAAVLPFTIKTETYFAVLRALFRTLDQRLGKIVEKSLGEPAKAYVEEIYRIDAAINRIQGYKGPFLFVLPILIQTAMIVLAFRTFSGKFQFQSDRLRSWLQGLSSKDPYYVLPLCLFISLIVRHNLFLPYKRKIALFTVDAMLFFLFLNQSAGFTLFVTCLVVLGALQAFLSDSRSKKLLIPSGEQNVTTKETFNLGKWLNDFKRTTFLFVIDDVLLSLFLSLISLLPSLVYLGYFYWKEKRQWKHIRNEKSLLIAGR